MLKKLVLSGFFASILLVSIVAYSIPVFAQNINSNEKSEVVAISGIVPGKELIVHVLVVVNPGEDRNQKALTALSLQGARPFTPHEFSELSLKWDQFSDNNPNNNFVIQNYNPSNDPTKGPDSGLDALKHTHATWNSVDSSNFEFQLGDANITRCPSLVQECKGRQTFDGNNDFAWLPLRDPNTLGVTWTGTSIDEADMALNTNFNWETDENASQKFDAETVILHENGHALGLGHEDSKPSIMAPYYSTINRILYQDDVDGITKLYPGTPSVTLPSVTIDDISKLEGDVGTTLFSFTVTRDDNTSNFELDYLTDLITADETDLTQINGNLQFLANGEFSKTLVVSVNADLDPEPTETFQIKLTNCSECIILDGIGEGAIIDDDGSTIIDITFGQYHSKRDVLTVRATSTDFNDNLKLYVNNVSAENPTWEYLGDLNSKGDGNFDGKFNDVSILPAQIKVEGKDGTFDIAAFN